MKRRLLAVLALIGPWCLFADSTNNLDPERLAYNLKTTVAAYEKVGATNSAWDPAAKDCLRAFARMRSRTDGLIGADTAELTAKLPGLIEKGCGDPMIRYLHLRFVEAGNNSPKANAAAYDETAMALQRSDYPDIRKFYANMWAYRSRREVDPSKRFITNFMMNAATCLARALEDKAMPYREADESCEFLMTANWKLSEGDQWNAYQIFEPALTNRFGGTSLALLTKGRAHLSAGWQARGTSLANAVTPEGWDLLEEHVDIAAKALVAAWELDPHDARVCLEMLKVEQVQGKGRARMEKWFQRGMEADPANRELCLAKLEYLRPRWYGSIEAMVDFGRECTDNTNYAGPVRLMLVDAYTAVLQEFGKDDKRRIEYWSQTNIWPDVKHTFDQFLTLYPGEVRYHQMYALYASYSEQWEEFFHQLKLSGYTNHEYFGGVNEFNRKVRTAHQQLEKKAAADKSP